MGSYKKSQLRQQILTTLSKSNPYSMKENAVVSKSDKKQTQVKNQDAAFIPATVQKHAQERVIELIEKVVKEPIDVSVPLSVPVHLQEDIQTLVLELLELIVPGSAQEQNDSEKTQSNSSNSTKSKKNKNYTNSFSTSNQVKEKQTENLHFQPKSTPSKATSSQNGALRDAIKLHEEGIKGNKQSVKNAISAFKDLAKQQKNNLEIKAYLGSATTLLGRDASSVTDKMKYALEGLKILDGVVQEAPNLVIARVLRGNVSYRLPEMYFQRTSTAIEDFSFLVSAYEKDSSILNEDEYVDILKNVIDACKRTNQSEKASMFQSKLKNINNVGSNVPVNANNSNEASSKTSKTKGKANGLTDEAILMHQKALNGGPTEVQRAIDFFESFVLTNTAPEVEMAYLDVQSMLGRDSNSTFEMFGSAIKSMKAMDRLINENPANPQLRLVRAKHSLRLPENFFRRSAIAVSDIEFLLTEYDKEPDSLNEETYQQLLFDLGCAYEKLEMIEEAKEAWNKLSQTSPSNGIQQLVNEKQEQYSYKQKKLRVLSQATKDKFYAEAKELHALGAKGNKLAAKQSLEAWGKAQQAYPDCEVANTYFAASIALVGKYASDPQEMFGETMKALKLLKTSIKTDNPELKFLRGSIYSVLPEGFFHSSNLAIRDFSGVRTAFERHHENPPISKDQYVKLLFDLGHLYKRTHLLDKAEKTFKKLVKVAPSSKYAQLIERQEGNPET